MSSFVDGIVDHEADAAAGEDDRGIRVGEVFVGDEAVDANVRPFGCLRPCRQVQWLKRPAQLLL